LDVEGLRQEAVKMIETLFQCNRSCNDVTPTECVLRHWQFVHNMSLVTPPGTNMQPAAPAPPCTLQSLVSILEDIGRFDLVATLSEITNSSRA